MHTQENEMLFSLAEKEKQEREKIEFDEAKKWLFDQDKWTQDLFRQSLTSLLARDTPNTEQVLEKRDLEFFNSIVDKMQLSEESRARMFKKFKRIGKTLFGDYNVGFLGGGKSFEELVIFGQNAELIPKSLDPKEAAKKLAIIQSHSSDYDLDKLLTTLNTSPNFNFLTTGEAKHLTLKSTIDQLFFGGEFAQKAFYLRNKNKKYFTDEEIEEIKSGIEKLENDILPAQHSR